MNFTFIMELNLPGEDAVVLRNETVITQVNGTRFDIVIPIYQDCSSNLLTVVFKKKPFTSITTKSHNNSPNHQKA